MTADFVLSVQFVVLCVAGVIWIWRRNPDRGP